MMYEVTLLFQCNTCPHGYWCIDQPKPTCTGYKSRHLLRTALSPQQQLKPEITLLIKEYSTDKQSTTKIIRGVKIYQLSHNLPQKFRTVGTWCLQLHVIFPLIIYSGPCILRPPLQTDKYGLRLEVLLKRRDIYTENIRMVSLIAGPKMEGIVKWRGLK